MPQFDTAEQVARDTAKRNGFEDGVDDIRVLVDEVEGNSRQLQVTIEDTAADQFFSKLVEQRQGISRTSTAEYVLPVPLGSPKNIFGSGNLLSGSDAENFWAAASGYCAGHESGDNKLAGYESYSQNAGSSECNNGSDVSDNYDSSGYLYAIDLPQNASSLKLQVYDAPYYTSGSTQDSSVASGSQNVTTIFEVYDRNPTPLDLSNLTLARYLHAHDEPVGVDLPEQVGDVPHVEQPAEGSVLPARADARGSAEQPGVERLRHPRVHGQLVLAVHDDHRRERLFGVVPRRARRGRHVDLRQRRQHDGRLLSRADRPGARRQDDARDAVRLG